VNLNIEVEPEEDGRWLAEVPDLPGVMKALALRVLADRLEHGENVPELLQVFSIPA